MPASILLVEDEPAIQELVSANLRRRGHAVRVCFDAESALREVQAQLPDLVLLDWMLPGMSGVELAQRLRKQARSKDLGLIMLTARGDEADKVAALECGADDYVTKPFGIRELLARVEAVLRRGRPHSSLTKTVVDDLELDPQARRVSHHGGEIHLGPTEFRLLHFLMTHGGRVYSRRQLLDQVWGDHVFVEERTVDVHIRRLRAALQGSGHDRLVRTVRGAGYSFGASGE